MGSPSNVRSYRGLPDNVRSYGGALLPPPPPPPPLPPPLLLPLLLPLRRLARAAHHRVLACACCLALALLTLALALLTLAHGCGAAAAAGEDPLVGTSVLARFSEDNQWKEAVVRRSVQVCACVRTRARVRVWSGPACLGPPLLAPAR